MAIFFLISNPAAMQALRREIDAGVVNGAISAPIRDAEAQKLPYLRAVIWETLRFHPPAVSQFYKEVPAGGATVEGHYLPGGTQLGINLQYVLRRSDTFGPDAEVFRPDRWIEAQAEAGGEDGGRYRDMLNVAEVVFGYGKFMCPGKTIAFMELTKVIVEVSRVSFLGLGTGVPC
jgi:cytochrome P450